MPKEPELFRAVITTRSSLNRTIFQRVNGNTKGGFSIIVARSSGP